MIFLWPFDIPPRDATQNICPWLDMCSMDCLKFCFNVLRAIILPRNPRHPASIRQPINICIYLLLRIFCEKLFLFALWIIFAAVLYLTLTLNNIRSMPFNTIIFYKVLWLVFVFNTVTTANYQQARSQKNLYVTRMQCDNMCRPFLID